MKSIVPFSLFILTFLLSSSLDGQSKFGFGAKAGINISDQVTSGTGEGVNVKAITRFHGGIYCNYFFTDKIAIQPELLVSGKGSDWNDPYYNVKDLLTYIDLPVLIKYQPLKLLNVHAGPQFGYLVSALQKNNDSGDTENINEYYKKPDLGLVLGVEANLPYRINVSARYVFGLIGTTTDVEYIESWLNNFFLFSLGFRIIGD
ncbi:MAG: PorT family protein [Bacteroidales bacterium]|nr:PorT family protein [Bacteroidales bacterium]